jgi:hypothetical protein
MLKLWLASFLTMLSRKLDEFSQWATLQAARLYEVEDLYLASEDGMPPDDRLYFLLKQADGRYVFHGLVARDYQDARKQAWDIPGSLMILESMEQFRLKLIAEADRRTHERAKRL